VRLFDIGVNVAPEYAYHFVYPERSAADPRVVAFRVWLLDERSGAVVARARRLIAYSIGSFNPCSRAHCCAIS
jgi:hypothetical protein